MKTALAVALFVLKIACLMSIDIFILMSVFSFAETPLLKIGLTEVPALICGMVFALAIGTYLNYRHTIRASWLSTKGLP